MRLDTPDVLPTVWSDLLGGEASPAAPDALNEAMDLDHILRAAYAYAHPRLHGNGNAKSFQMVLFQTGVVAALYEPSVAKGFLSVLCSERLGLSRAARRVGWRVRGGLFVLAAAERGCLALGSQLPKMPVVVRLVLKSEAARRDRLIEKTVTWILTRLQTSHPEIPLGWDPHFPERDSA